MGGGGGSRAYVKFVRFYDIQFKWWKYQSMECFKGRYVMVLPDVNTKLSVRSVLEY